MAVELRYARSQDYPRISDFLDQFWAKDYIYVRNRELFDWTFGRNDLWDQDGYSFALMEDKDELVGILGAIPFAFNRTGKVSRAIWFANYMVRPDYRRGPLAMRLLGSFHREPYALWVVFGMNSNVVPIYQRMGWRILNPIPRYLVVLPNATDKVKRLIRLAHPNCDPDRALALSRFFTLNKDPLTVSLACDRTLPPHWDELDWPYIASQTMGAARNLKYLSWRYVNHPCLAYQVLAVPEGSRTGVIIWRLETIRERTSCGDLEIDRVGRIVEFLPASQENARDLIAVFLKELGAADALGADFYGYHKETGSWLEESGFRNLDRHPDGQMIPSRFQPLEPRGGTILSAVFDQNNIASCCEFPHQWYWTKSDADQDRPN